MSRREKSAEEQIDQREDLKDQQKPYDPRDQDPFNVKSEFLRHFFLSFFFIIMIRITRIRGILIQSS